MLSSSREILIVIDVADKTGGRLEGLKKSLLAIDAAAQKAHAKLAAIGNRAYSASIRLIDRVSQPGSRINSLLKSLASKTYTIGMKLNDAVFGKIRSLEASLMKIAGRAYTVTVNLKDNISGKLKGLTDGMLMGVGGMGVGMLGTAGIGYGAVNAAQAYMSFEKQMSKVQAVAMLDKTSPEMQMLTQQAKDLGAQTAWTREEVGQAQYYQAMAGWTPELIKKATPAILNLASAGATDLGTTSDIVTDTMTGFQIRADETYRDAQGNFVNAAEHYADVMAKLVTSANTDIPQLGEALKYSSNVIGAMYADKDTQTRFHAMEDAMVMTGLMANAGIKGSMAGTATRAVFSRFGSENRNAYFGLQALGVDFKDANGEVRRIRDIFHDLNQRFSQGVSAEGIAEFAEMMSETKLHADTRRKLTSFMESVQAHGGKMTGAERLKLSSMLAGQEAMSGFMAAIMGDWDSLAEKIDNAHGAAAKMADIQLGNLSGDLTILGSAWDAFQQSFFEGQAGEGLRAFVQSITEVISRANKLFADGIQIGDIGNLIMDVVDRLKNKFMELDGIGSILAGGALMAGLVKIGTTAQKLIGFLKTLKGLEIGQRMGGATGAGSKGGTVSAATSVGTMNVSAGVVNINGKAGGTAGGVGGRRVGDQTIIDRYNQEKARIRGTGAPPPPSMRSTFTGGAKMGAAFAGIFALLDVFNAKSMSAENLTQADAALQAARSEYENLKATGAENGHLAQQLQEIQRLEADRNQVLADNQKYEKETLAGATVGVLGAAIGAGLGSLIGPMGTMIGGMIGGMIGDKLGRTAAELGGETPQPENEPDYFGFNETKESPIAQVTTPTSSMADFKVAEDASRNYYLRYQRDGNQDLAGIAEAQSRRRAADLREKEIAQATVNQRDRFNKIDEKLGAFSPFQHAATYDMTADYYRQQATQLTKPPEVKPIESLGSFFDDLLFSKAAAAELPSGESAEVMAPDLSAFEDTQSTLDGFLESFSTFGDTISEYLSGATESITGFAESISEGFTGAFEGATETLSAFGESISESLTGAFETAGEMISTFGDTIGEGLTGVLEGAGEMFTGFGDLVTSALTTAQGAAESALAAIGSSFESARASIMSAWGELPGFFGGIFDGLGGVAAAAGSAIYSGLTSVIGAVIGAWESAASAVSSIISSISAMASSVSMPSFGGGSAFAEGGFVNSPTQALIGEAGAEVVIPLSGSKRTRALDLFEKTAQILGGEASIPMSDFTAENIPELSNSFSGFTVDAPTPIAPNGNQSANSSEVNMGGINVSFTISGANNPQEVMETIKENLAELADRIAGQLGKTVNESFNNMSVGH